MKTAKITTVVEVRPHTNTHGTVLYHNLVMDNGDKINIGKKTEQKEGWSLTYEIVEEGQHEYNKAKAVNPNDMPQQTNQATPAPQRNTPQPQRVNVDDSILYQVCLKGVFDFMIANGSPTAFTADGINETALQMAQAAKVNIAKL